MSLGPGTVIITVAAYSAEVANRAITKFSSRGPLADYGSGISQPSKPDIAAPGRKVDAAKGIHAKPWKKTRTTPKSGTSMSAPHVAGAIALMLQDKPTLTVAQIATTLEANPQVKPPPVTATTQDEAGGGRLDAKKAFDNTP